MIHYKTAREAFVPTVLPDNVVPLNRSCAIDAEAKKLERASLRLNEVSADVRTLRQLLESTLDEAQREVFHDIAAKELLQGRLAFELEIQMRELVRNRASRG